MIKMVHPQLFTFRQALFILIFILNSSLFSQAFKSPVYEDYIDQNKEIAIKHMKKYKIPASITLAQGLLESGAGVGELVLRSNNHFGIKCHSDWRGGRVLKDDDKVNECFRKYNHREESFEDHSRFLSERPRYNSLFYLDVTDYMGWARGLQQAGYATDKAYANKLIKLIDDYELYHYDHNGLRDDNKLEKLHTSSSVKKHKPYKTHGLVYVLAEDGATYEDVASEFDFRADELYKYNEVPPHFPLRTGDIVYFEYKKTKADKPHFEHEVKVGESMHSISQRYGLRLINLYSLNKKDFEYVPVEGDILKLR